MTVKFFMGQPEQSCSRKNVVHARNEQQIKHIVGWMAGVRVCVCLLPSACLAEPAAGNWVAENVCCPLHSSLAGSCPVPVWAAPPRSCRHPAGSAESRSPPSRLLLGKHLQICTSRENIMEHDVHHLYLLSSLVSLSQCGSKRSSSELKYAVVYKYGSIWTHPLSLYAWFSVTFAVVIETVFVLTESRYSNKDGEEMSIKTLGFQAWQKSRAQFYFMQIPSFLKYEMSSW